MKKLHWIIAVIGSLELLLGLLAFLALAILASSLPGIKGITGYGKLYLRTYLENIVMVSCLLPISMLTLRRNLLGGILNIAISLVSIIWLIAQAGWNIAHRDFNWKDGLFFVISLVIYVFIIWYFSRRQTKDLMSTARIKTKSAVLLLSPVIFACACVILIYKKI